MIGYPLPYTQLVASRLKFISSRDGAWFNLGLQVPTWLNVSNPKVTVVPHSSIFFNTSHLPTFNTNAINANIINIPGWCLI